MTPLPLSERLGAAHTTLIVARASFDIWWVYASASTRPSYFPGMDEYSEFFRFDEEAHFRGVVVELYTLFDGRSDTVTLKSLINSVEAAGNDVTAVRAKLSLLTKKIVAIKTLRHELFAHRDHGLAYNSVYKLAGVRPDDLRSVLDESLAILNSLAQVLSMSAFQFNEFVTEITVDLLLKIQPLQS